MRVLLAATLAALALGILAPAVPGVGSALPWQTSVVAATPQPSSDTASDTRSAGEGPGLVGAPLIAIGTVAGLALLMIVATLGYVRLTGGPGPDPGRNRVSGSPGADGAAEPGQR